MQRHVANAAHLRSVWLTEMSAAKTANAESDAVKEWSHLERAHIVSQPLGDLHVRTHAAMLVAAARKRDLHEVGGQLFRLVVAAPGSLTGRYPVGNTGGANVSAFAPMPIPEDLQRVLDDDGSETGSESETEQGDGDFFPTEVSGLPHAVPTSTVRLEDGDDVELHISAVQKQIGGDRLRMLAYNRSIPGPLLHVDQGSTVTVHVANDGDLEATVHWHGLRVENQFDGVPFETQMPIPVGGTYDQTITFPDAGIYWYHPHIREDYGLELGLYGTVVVEPADPSFWSPADRHLTITLDDLLVEDGKIAPFRRAGPTYTAMGRFGNVMLINGDVEFSGEASVGEVVRLFVVNTANTRMFRFGMRGARMKLVGGDSGRYEHETFVDDVLLAPSERAVIDVLFDTPGAARLEHRTPDHVYDLGAFSVAGDVCTDTPTFFDVLRVDSELAALREEIADDFTRAPDKTLILWSEMPLLHGDTGPIPDAGAAYLACPMHPEVAASFAATCPKCGMKLIPASPEVRTTTPYQCPMHEEITASWAATCPRCGMTLVASEPTSTPHSHADESHTHVHDERIEWEDDMVAINRATDDTNMVWQLIDGDTGAKNADIAWKFTVGDRVKIRIVNEKGSDHPMPHPFHVHGAGRFLVLSTDGVAERNLAWKDTVLVLAGQTVDILLYVTNPGRWMAHCHIAEHNQSGMMFSFEVVSKPGAQSARDDVTR
jgi:FtsP/CotA-like multicopper oxidase with cupredoxin domain